MSEDSKLQLHKTRLQKALNNHGYAFHRAVLKFAAQLLTDKKSSWCGFVNEFPVECENWKFSNPTRIDLILEHATDPILLVGECKRVNPALANWTFLKTPFAGSHELANMIYYENIVFPGRENTFPPTRLPALCLQQDVFATLRVMRCRRWRGIRQISPDRGKCGDPIARKHRARSLRP
ncbi:hypothetical protein N9X87_00055 [bacterium]|nr:hypothetical protein [bacterium]